MSSPPRHVYSPSTRGFLSCLSTSGRAPAWRITVRKCFITPIRKFPNGVFPYIFKINGLYYTLIIYTYNNIYIWYTHDILADRCWLTYCYNKGYQPVPARGMMIQVGRHLPQNWANDPCSLKLAVKSISLKADWYVGWTFDSTGSIPSDQRGQTELVVTRDTFWRTQLTSGFAGQQH